MTRSWNVAVLTSLFCSGCVIGPPYQRPVAPAPVALKEMAGNDQWKMATPSDDLPKGKWWEVFGDPQLNRLEELVNINNQNLKQAEAQFRQARALVALNRANYYPTISTTPAITQTNVGPNAGRGAAGSSQSFSLPADVTWEPDLWGRVRLSVENAVSNAQVSAADLENVRLSQQALLATDYFSLAADDMQQTVLRDTIEAYQKNLTLTTDRFNGGVASRSDITLAQTQLSGARAQSTDLRVLRAQYEHAIATLIGKPPAAFSIAPAPQTPLRLPVVPVGLPATLLERRPDIAVGERRVAEANDQIGIARAAFFPSLVLSATGGFSGTSITNWFNWPSRMWAVGPQMSQTLFDAGRRRAVSESATANYDGTVASYRQTTLSAFQEVEDNLAALRILETEAQQQQQATASASESLQLFTNRYVGGVDNYLQVITAQTALLTNQRNDNDIQRRRMDASVLLVKAIGGGWDASQLPRF